MRSLVVLATTGLIVFAGAAPAGATEPGAACGSSSSALDQYCQNLPSANGHGGTLTPNANTPTLAGALPPSAVQAYERLTAAKRNRARKLLSLAAPAPAVPLGASAHTSAWALPLGVILAMIAIAAAIASAVIARRRQRTA